MGDYTTFSVDFVLKPDVPAKVKGIVRHMLHLDNVEEPSVGWNSPDAPADWMKRPFSAGNPAPAQRTAHYPGSIGA